MWSEGKKTDWFFDNRSCSLLDPFTYFWRSRWDRVWPVILRVFMVIYLKYRGNLWFFLFWRKNANAFELLLMIADNEAEMSVILLLCEICRKYYEVQGPYVEIAYWGFTQMIVFFLWKIINLTRVRAFHKLLGNFLAISCISGNFFLFEQPFAFWAISLVIF